MLLVERDFQERIMSNFVRVANVAEIPDPGKLTCEVEDRLVVVFHVAGQIYCLDDVCTHDGGTLGEGRLLDHSIACPRHGAKFDIRSGKPLSMPATEPTAAHEVRIAAGEIFVRLRTADSTEANALPDSFAASAAPAMPTLAVGHHAHDATGECCGHPPAAVACAAVETVALAPLGLCEDSVREELKKVVDPELFVNIVDLGLVYVVDLQPQPEAGTQVRIEMTLTSPMCPAGPQIIANSKQVVGAMPGVSGVEVKIVLDPAWTPDRMSDAARDQLGIF